MKRRDVIRHLSLAGVFVGIGAGLVVDTDKSYLAIKLQNAIDRAVRTQKMVSFVCWDSNERLREVLLHDCEHKGCDFQKKGAESIRVNVLPYSHPDHSRFWLNKDTAWHGGQDGQTQNS